MTLLKTLILICTAGAALASGQTGKDPKKAVDEGPIEIRTNLMVVDAAQAPVGDLKAGDIKLYDNDVEQKITYFVRKPTTNIAFVMDNTGSMRPQLDVEIRFAKALAANLRSGDEAKVVRFVSRDKITVWQEWTDDKSKLNSAFDNLYVEGGQSAVIDSLYLTANTMLKRAKSEEDGRFAIILISDGEDRDSYYTTKQLYSLLEGSGIQIFAVGLDKDLDRGARDRAEKFMRELTDQTSGSLYFFDKKYSVPEFQDGARGLLTELRSQYVIGYNKKGQPGKLRVEIADGAKGEKRIGTVKGGFGPQK